MCSFLLICCGKTAISSAIRIRRSVRVSITPAGREKLLDNMSRVVGSLNRILSVFTEDEMRDVARLYSKFASATAEQLGER